jgi:hypothetical protein
MSDEKPKPQDEQNPETKPGGENNDEVTPQTPQENGNEMFQQILNNFNNLQEQFKGMQESMSLLIDGGATIREQNDTIIEPSTPPDADTFEYVPIDELDLNI